MTGNRSSGRGNLKSATSICGIGLIATVGILTGCGVTDREAPDPATLAIEKPAERSGDRQVGVAGETLPESLRVLVTRDGRPVEGVTVVWFTLEGSVAPTMVRTDAEGFAASTWTLLSLFAEQFAGARLAHEDPPAVGFSAIATPDPAAPNTILVLNDGGAGGRFEPAALTVVAGGTVNWFWPPGSSGHNVVPDDGDTPPQSGALAGWPTWHSFQFTRPGTYRYHCAAHGSPGGGGESGAITVIPVSDAQIAAPAASPTAKPIPPVSR